MLDMMVKRRTQLEKRKFFNLSLSATYCFILLIFFVSLSTSVIADNKLEDFYGPKLYDIDNDKTYVRFVTKMCTADVLKGEFEKLVGQIYFDRENPENSWVEVTLDASSLSFDKKSHGDHNIKAIIEGDNLLKVLDFPVIKLKSTKIERTGLHTGMMTADMTLVGETHPITLEVTFENTMTDRYARSIDSNKIAFSAYGTFKRSDWNILYALDRVGIRRINDEMQVLVAVSASIHQETITAPEK